MKGTLDAWHGAAVLPSRSSLVTHQCRLSKTTEWFFLQHQRQSNRYRGDAPPFTRSVPSFHGMLRAPTALSFNIQTCCVAFRVPVDMGTIPVGDS